MTSELVIDVQQKEISIALLEDKKLVEYSKKSGLPLLDYNEASFADGSYMDAYNAFYDNLLK